MKQTKNRTSTYSFAGQKLTINAEYSAFYKPVAFLTFSSTRQSMAVVCPLPIKFEL